MEFHILLMNVLKQQSSLLNISAVMQIKIKVA